MQISFTHGPTELPRAPAYHLLVIGGFDPSAADGNQAPIRISRTDFQAVMDRIAPAIALDIDNRLTGNGETWWVRLQFRSLKDFTPAALIRQVPELDWIDALRRTIEDVAAGKRPAPTLREVLDDYAGIDGLAEVIRLCRTALAEEPSSAPVPGSSPPPQAGRPAADDDLDRLFDMVSAPDQEDSGSAARNAVAGAIAAATRKGGRPRPMSGSGLADAAAAVTALLEAQLQGILSHPRFLDLEQAWRGLHWLLAGIGGDAPVDVQVLPRSAQTAAAAIGAVTPTDAAEPAARFDLVLCDAVAGRTDLEWIRALAAAAEAAMTPVLITLDGRFFTPPGDRPLGRVRDPANLLEQPEYQKWNALGADAAMRWLGACFNDVILRPPYRAGDRHAAGITQPQDPATFGLWGHAGWLVARRIAEQQQQGDWPAPITGAKVGRLADLPLMEAEDTAGEPRPLRHALSPDQAEELGNVGIIALACVPGQDSAWIMGAPSLLRVQAQAQPETTRALRRDASLPAQLLRARLVHCISSALEQLPGGSAAERAAALQHYAGALIANTGGSAQASADVDPQHPDRVRLRMQLGERVMPALSVELQLD